MNKYQAELQDSINTAKELNSLLANPIFNKLITKQYLEEEPMNLVYTLGLANVNTEEVVKKLTSIAHLKMYLDDIRDLGQSAQKALEENILGE